MSHSTKKRSSTINSYQVTVSLVLLVITFPIIEEVESVAVTLVIPLTIAPYIYIYIWSDS